MMLGPAVRSLVKNLTAWAGILTACEALQGRATIGLSEEAHSGRWASIYWAKEAQESNMTGDFLLLQFAHADYRVPFLLCSVVKQAVLKGKSPECPPLFKPEPFDRPCLFPLVQERALIEKMSGVPPPTHPPNQQSPKC